MRDDGTVKVLDFGLAKVLASAASGHDVETLTALDTQAGLVMGTPAYMSPEQARGAAVDERTDIWAFGCVLYELLSGRRTFVGDSAVQILNAVIEREPDWSAIAHVPPALQKLVRRCLQKDPRRRLRDIGDARLEIDDAETGGDTPHTGGAGKPRRPWLWLTVGLAAGLVVAASFAYWRRQPTPDDARPNVRFQNVTDAVGLEESPAISHDGKMVAFTAFSGGRRQLFVRVLAGGVSRQVTNDDLDHEHPRWAPDSTTILYLGRSASGDHSALYEIPFLGGPPRPIVPALTGGDISRLDGQKIAVFQKVGGVVKLVVVRRDGTPLNEVVPRTPGRQAETTPRWAPDGQSIAYIDSVQIGFNDAINIVSAAGGEPRRIVDGDIVRGLSWLPDGSGLVFGSGLESTVTYPPTFQLRMIRITGAASEQLTYGIDSLTDPDVHESGLVLAMRTTMSSAIWQMPATGTPALNHKDARIVTHLTSQVQTPSISHDGKELVYPSDSGGHGNLWVIGTDGEGRRQLTTEIDPSVKVAVPVWSPVDSTIAFLKIVGTKTEQWLVNGDGTNLRRLLEGGVAVSWSPDGKWIYYAATGTDGTCIKKIRLADKIVETVRCGNATKPLLRKDGTLFFEHRLVATSGGFDYELHKANPENRPDTTLLRRIDARQIAWDSRLGPSEALSPDGHWVALALMNRATTNLWRMSTESGELHQVTDFGDRATWIIRQIAWSLDSKFIYTAIADLDADVVSITGVVSAKAK